MKLEHDPSPLEDLGNSSVVFDKDSRFLKMQNLLGESHYRLVGK